MKGVLLLSMTIFIALCMIDVCEGWPRFPKPRKPTYPGPTYPGPTWPRPTWRRSATIDTEHKRATLNDDNQDEDIANEELQDEHLDERYVDMNDEDVMGDIDQRYMNDPEEDD
uniref:Myticalin D5 n=1 Tax=Mytilus galloprovincialis TaxID=29158 RepID=A0A286RMW0_MYTGA|nr:myticalin D5 [Mytilus galloprovincialis]